MAGDQRPRHHPQRSQSGDGGACDEQAAVGLEQDIEAAGILPRRKQGLLRDAAAGDALVVGEHEGEVGAVRLRRAEILMQHVVIVETGKAGGHRIDGVLRRPEQLGEGDVQGRLRRVVGAVQRGVEFAVRAGLQVAQRVQALREQRMDRRAGVVDAPVARRPAIDRGVGTVVRQPPDRQESREIERDGLPERIMLAGAFRIGRQPPQMRAERRFDGGHQLRAQQPRRGALRLRAESFQPVVGEARELHDRVEHQRQALELWREVPGFQRLPLQFDKGPFGTVRSQCGDARQHDGRIGGKEAGPVAVGPVVEIVEPDQPAEPDRERQQIRQAAVIDIGIAVAQRRQPAVGLAGRAVENDFPGVSTHGSDRRRGDGLLPLGVEGIDQVAAHIGLAHGVVDVDQ